MFIHTNWLKQCICLHYIGLFTSRDTQNTTTPKCPNTQKDNLEVVKQDTHNKSTMKTYSIGPNVSNCFTSGEMSI